MNEKVKKTNKKYYWKVVDTISPGVFRSFVIGRGKYSLTYKIGIPTKSAMDENGIFVLETRKQAREYKSYFRAGGTIFKCKVNGEEIKHPRYYSTWGLGDGKKIFVPEGSFVLGTRSFPLVTLVE